MWIFQKYLIPSRVETQGYMAHRNRKIIWDHFFYFIHLGFWVLSTISHPLYPFIWAVEGETNPRNLHLIFGLWPLVLSHFDFTFYAEDVFELLSCYFPIDFKPAKSASVTSEELAERKEDEIRQFILRNDFLTHTKKEEKVKCRKEHLKNSVKKGKVCNIICQLRRHM